MTEKLGKISYFAAYDCRKTVNLKHVFNKAVLHGRNKPVYSLVHKNIHFWLYSFLFLIMRTVEGQFFCGVLLLWFHVVAAFTSLSAVNQ